MSLFKKEKSSLNVPILRGVVTIVEDRERSGAWKFYAGKDNPHNICGTTFCTAGLAMLLAGYKINPELKFTKPDGTLFDGSYVDEAAGVLGISRTEAEEMFYAETDKSSDVRKWADTLAKRRGIETI